MPLWVALALAAGAYCVRSVMRGLDFRPDMPTDAIVLIALVLVLIMVHWVRANDESSASHDAAPTTDEEDGPES